MTLLVAWAVYEWEIQYNQPNISNANGKYAHIPIEKFYCRQIRSYLLSRTMADPLLRTIPLLPTK